ncbi:hypothetical protein [Pedobacter steynii]
MKNRHTPKPGSSKYNTEKPQQLTTPEYRSSTERRASNELPATENLDDETAKNDTEISKQDRPKTNLGNPRSKGEDDREKLITP